MYIVILGLNNKVYPAVRDFYHTWKCWNATWSS